MSPSKCCHGSCRFPSAGSILDSLLQLRRSIVMPEESKLFSRNLKKSYPVAVSGEGCWITDAEGRRYLDAAGQAAVVNIGHGVKEICAATAGESHPPGFSSL